MITMLGLSFVVTLVEQRLLFYQIQPGKRSYMAPTLVLLCLDLTSGLCRAVFPVSVGSPIGLPAY